MGWWRSFLEWLRKLWGRKAAAATLGCVDFSTMTSPPPPSLTGTNGGTAKFQTTSPAGSGGPLNPPNRLRTANGNTGLDCNFTLDIDFPVASQLTFKLIHTAQPATIEAKDSAGAVVGTGAQAPPQHVVSTVTISAPGMVQATVHSPADEVVLLEFCAT